MLFSWRSEEDPILLGEDEVSPCLFQSRKLIFWRKDQMSIVESWLSFRLFFSSFSSCYFFFLLQECVDFIAANLNAILNAILQVGVEGTCEKVCDLLPSSTEQAACTLLCLYTGFKDFIHALNQDDLDPVYLCAALRACKNNTCSGPCTTVESAASSPSSAPLRSKFTLSATVKALKDNIGVGVTLFQFPCDAPACQNPIQEFAVVNDGMAKGATEPFSIEINTEEQDWMYKVGTTPVTVFSCGSDCYNEHGTVFSAGYTNFTITQ